MRDPRAHRLSQVGDVGHSSVSWLVWQLRAIKLLAAGLGVPGLRSAALALTRTPRTDTDTEVAGVPATVACPGAGDRWPALVFLNGVTRRGRFHPDVARLTDALARCGFLVVAPDPPGLARGELSLETLEATIAVLADTAARPDVRGGRVGVVGVSFGVALGLIAAEQPGLADRVSIVAGIAPWVDVASVVRLVTTGTRSDGTAVGSVPSPPPFLSLVAARSLVAALPATPERDRIRRELLDMADDEPNPLALFRGLDRRSLEPDMRALVEVLANDSPARFDELYAGMPAALRAGLSRLSAITAAGALRAPVELACAPNDPYLPLSEVRRLVAAATQARVRLTPTATLDHAVPRLGLADLAGLARFDAWAVRVIRTASRA